MIHPCDGRTDGRAIAYSALSVICCRALKHTKMFQQYYKTVLLPGSVYITYICLIVPHRNCKKMQMRPFQLAKMKKNRRFWGWFFEKFSTGELHILPPVWRWVTAATLRISVCRSVNGERGAGAVWRSVAWILSMGDVRGAMSLWWPGDPYHWRHLRSDGLWTLHPSGVRLHRLQDQRETTGCSSVLWASSLSDSRTRPNAW